MELDPIDRVEQARDTRVIKQARSRLNVLLVRTGALPANFT